VLALCFNQKGQREAMAWKVWWVCTTAQTSEDSVDKLCPLLKEVPVLGSADFSAAGTVKTF
jgi:hypothetical protein